MRRFTINLLLLSSLLVLGSCGKHETNSPTAGLKKKTETLPTLSASESAVLAIQSDKYDEFTQLVLDHDLNINFTHANGHTFLIEAILWSRVEIVEWLLGRESIDAEAKDQDGMSPLEHAQIIGNKDILKLLKGGQQSQEEIDAGLFEALYAKDQKAIKEAIDSGANLNIHDKKGLTPLILAIYLKDEMAVRLLLQTRKVDVNLADKRTNKTPLSWSKRAKLTRVEKMLERMGAHE